MDRQGLLSPEGTWIKCSPVICPSSRADGIVSDAACLMADEWWYARMMGTRRKLRGGLTTKSLVPFHMCNDEMISLWKLKTTLLFIYLFIGEKKCIMWWHKILIICPGIHTSRRINQSNKTNSIDWLSDYIKHSVSMWSFAAIHCVVYDYKLFFSTKHTMLKCHYCLGEIIIISCCQCLRFKKTKLIN